MLALLLGTACGETVRAAPTSPVALAGASTAVGQVQQLAGRAQRRAPGRTAQIPQSAEILFTSNRDTGTSRREVYAMNGTGGNVQRLTFTQEHHFITSVDRSRRFLLVSRADLDTQPPAGLGDEDRRSLWTLDLVTGAETQLTDPAHHAEADSFSPDGQWIVFLMRLAGDNQADIYKIRRDGSALTQLTNTPVASEGDPAWSHDGGRIAYAFLDPVLGRFVLKTMDTAGGSVELVHDGGPGPGVAIFPPGTYDPSWSPDDQWLVFERPMLDNGANWGSGVWHVFKVRLDGTGLQDLSLAGGHDDRAEYGPHISPDGTRVVFGSFYAAPISQDSHNDVFTMDLAGGTVLALTTDNDSEKDQGPIWIP